jgi:hypothetical protein
MVLRLGDSTATTQAKRRGHIHSMQLAYQLHHRPDRAHRSGEHRVQVLHCMFTFMEATLMLDFRNHQCVLPSRHLFLLSGDRWLVA